MSNTKNIFYSILFLAIFALHPSLNKEGSPAAYLQYLTYGNTINLSQNGNINQKAITVIWACENSSINCNELIIYKNGKKINDIPFEEGNQKLIVYYYSKTIGTLKQNKSSKTQAHQYQITLNTEANTILFNGEITGPSSYKIATRHNLNEQILATK